MNADEDELKRLFARYRNFRFDLSGHPIEAYLSMVKRTRSMSLVRYANAWLDRLHAELQNCPFLQPTREARLGEGKVHILETLRREPIRVSFDQGEPNPILHLVLAGMVKMGKSSLQALMAIQAAAAGYYTFLTDPEQFYRRIPSLHSSHDFARWTHLRLNPFQVPKGIPEGMYYSMIISEFCRSYGLQFAELEIVEVVGEIAQRDIPNIVSILSELKAKSRRTPGFSRRNQYRDSAILVLQKVLASTGELFRCSEGMDVIELLSGNRVLEVDGMPVEERRFLMRYLLELLHLSAVNNMKLTKPLLFMVDEAQRVVCG